MNYYMLLWSLIFFWMFCSKTLSKEIERIHKRALKADFHEAKWPAKSPQKEVPNYASKRLVGRFEEFKEFIILCIDSVLAWLFYSNSIEQPF